MHTRTLAFSIFVMVALLLITGIESVRPSLAQSPTPTISSASSEITFPDLTGPYTVGRTSYEWIDPSRDDAFASVPGLKRDLMVYIWFPASTTTRTKLLPYMDGDLMWDLQWGEQRGLAGSVHSHAYRTALVDKTTESYPVLIFAHGYGLNSLNYASIIEEIASHGYIVIATSHPYNTSVISYPDGRLVVAGAVEKAVKSDMASLTASLPVWTQDVRFVLDQAEKLNTTDESFKGRLDLSRIGVFGHSFGGITSAQVVALDPRISAGANLDGGNALVALEAMSKPFLFIGKNGLPTASQQLAGAHWLSIKGADHLNYGDFGLLRPLIPTMSLLGTIDPARGLQIVNSYLLTFFDHHLKGADLNWPSYDEAELTTYE